MPLSLLPIAQQRTVRRLEGRTQTCLFLAHIGFTPGSVVYKVSEETNKIIVHIENSRVTISKSMADCIFV